MASSQGVSFVYCWCSYNCETWVYAETSLNIFLNWEFRISSTLSISLVDLCRPSAGTRCTKCPDSWHYPTLFCICDSQLHIPSGTVRHDSCPSPLRRLGRSHDDSQRFYLPCRRAVPQNTVTQFINSCILASAKHLECLPLEIQSYINICCLLITRRKIKLNRQCILLSFKEYITFHLKAQSKCYAETCYWND